MKPNIKIVENLFKSMIEEMPLDKYFEMTLYKLVKDGLDCTKLIAVISCFQSIGYCLDDFYKEKLKDLIEEVNDDADDNPDSP